MVSTLPIRTNRPISLGFQVLWYIGCILTLGYASKYSRRIEEWQVYDPSLYDEKYRAYSLPIDTKWLGLESSKRAKQQKEWDRLMVPFSIITATSAAALAIPGPLNLHWLTAAFYTTAFGLSLEGLLLTTYLTVFGSSSSPETIGRLANGKGFLRGTVGPVAIVTALPVAMVTYAALFLLGGLIVMTCAAGNGAGISERQVAFRAIVLFPVCIMMLCLVVAVVGCEVFIWMESKYAQPGDVEGSGGLPCSVEKGADGSC
ncbi:unnamed protein product [Rhizoctonia solani]|uniref:Uncharacterized protein n=1 Tax=Rhizoctonia solani TaxID=456999 RepID=A0A8H3A0E6_9AGAM|nr:unnamed protein product [Rhizoctonia solani]